MINNKEKYLELSKNMFEEDALSIVNKQIELFYDDSANINKTKYNKEDKVFLMKNTFIHGIPGEIDSFDYVIKNGFISTNFTNQPGTNKICNSLGVWNIKEDCFLIDYINRYSGVTLNYHIGRGPGSRKESILVPYHKFDEITEKINNDNEIWMYTAEQTKEVRFIPSLVANKRQIAFIFNMESDYAKEISKNDVWNKNLSEDIVRQFLDYRYADQFINEDRINRNASTTDRESAIIFGLPTHLIEGVLVGRKIENDDESLKHIKEKLPDCYICNLDGKVIVGNK